MEDRFLVLGDCYTCGKPYAGCPECVVTIRVDSLTGLPPDVEHAPGGGHVTTERAQQQLLCDECIVSVNARRTPDAQIETAERRHLRHVVALADVPGRPF